MEPWAGVKLPVAIRLEDGAPRPSRGGGDVTIVWKGNKIAKLIFPSGKIVEFDEPVSLKEKKNITNLTDRFKP